MEASPSESAVPLFRMEGVSKRYGGVQALEKYGIARGSWLTARRIVRCRPGTPMGTVDYP